MADLLLCPFCGGLPIKKEVKFWTGMRNDLIRVEYQHWCEFGTPRQKVYIKADGTTDEEAIASWNRRAAPIDPQPVADLTLLEQAREFVELGANREYLGVVNGYKLREKAADLLIEIDRAVLGLRSKERT